MELYSLTKACGTDYTSDGAEHDTYECIGNPSIEACQSALTEAGWSFNDIQELRHSLFGYSGTLEEALTIHDDDELLAWQQLLAWSATQEAAYRADAEQQQSQAQAIIEYEAKQERLNTAIQEVCGLLSRNFVNTKPSRYHQRASLRVSDHAQKWGGGWNASSQSRHGHKAVSITVADPQSGKLCDVTSMADKDECGLADWCVARLTKAGYTIRHTRWKTDTEYEFVAMEPCHA